MVEVLALHQGRCASSLMQQVVLDQHYRDPMPDSEDQLAQRLKQLGSLIKITRLSLGWNQFELADIADVGRATVQRYENAESKAPQPDAVRRIFLALKLDPREIPVILGYVTAEEMGLPAEPRRPLAPTVEEAVGILQDPEVPDAVKAEWVSFLRYRTGRPDTQGSEEAV